jgi:uncharacterized membrane protein
VFPEDLIGSGIPPELVVLVISALPIFELRGGIPVAIGLFHLPWYYAMLLSVIGNMLPVPFILSFLDSATRLLGRIRLCDRFLTWLFERTRRRGRIIEIYQRIGLVLFVAIPLPITGAWTGSLAAVLFGLKLRNALLSIFIGVLIAGTIVTCLSVLGLHIYGMWQQA